MSTARRDGWGVHELGTEERGFRLGIEVVVSMISMKEGASQASRQALSLSTPASSRELVI